MELFLKGLVVGLAISAPMGSVGILVIHRVIAHSRTSGFIVGLGSVLADAIFGIIAMYGLTAITRLINEHQFGLSILGGTLLLYIAINIYFSKPKAKKVVFDNFFTYPKDFATGFILTITNPLTIIAILALFAWFGFNDPNASILSELNMLIGFVIGLVLWWITLISVTTHIKNRVEIPAFGIINKIFGVILLVIAVLVLVRVL